MVQVRRYADADRAGWDGFVRAAKNGHFFFERGYLEYHADRFADHSLLFARAGELVAVLPVNRVGDTLVSHGGLTFGGFVSGENMRTPVMLELFAALTRHAREIGVRTVVYKPAPHIYHRLPAEEDLYALYRCNAALVRRDVSSAVGPGPRLPMSERRKRGLKRARASDIAVRRSEDIDAFMAVLAARLGDRYGVRPTHTAAEMRLLAARFPQNIKLFAAYRGGGLLGGVVVFETPRVAHAQYIATTDDGRDLGALDAVTDFLLNEVYRDTAYFDFGISTEQHGRYLNEGLIENKESYGARAVVYDRYELLVDAAEAAPPAGPVRAAADLPHHLPAAD
jgi:hypothetical protein